MKKAMGIISNILSVLLVCPFSLYFSVLGLMLISCIDFKWSFTPIINTVSSVNFICTLPACITGIILSIVFRIKGKYKESYFIQLLPFASVIVGVFWFVVSMIWGNP